MSIKSTHLKKTFRFLLKRRRTKKAFKYAYRGFVIVETMKKISPNTLKDEERVVECMYYVGLYDDLIEQKHVPEEIKKYVTNEHAKELLEITMHELEGGVLDRITKSIKSAKLLSGLLSDIVGADKKQRDSLIRLSIPLTLMDDLCDLRETLKGLNTWQSLSYLTFLIGGIAYYGALSIRYLKYFEPSEVTYVLYLIIRGGIEDLKEKTREISIEELKSYIRNPT